jgi:hypothetical protein
MKDQNFQLMYLYVPTDDEPKQSSEAPTDDEVSCVRSEILQVYRWYGGAYEHLTVQKGKPVWETVDSDNG